MLPNVEAQQRGQSCAYGIASVRFFGDVQLAVLINRQPCPARTEQSDCCRVEFLLEILETAEVAFDGFRQFPGRFALRRFRCELQEVQRMVQHLSGIVEYGAIGCSGYDSNQVFCFHTPCPEQGCSGCLRTFAGAYRNGNLLFAD